MRCLQKTIAFYILLFCSILTITGQTIRGKVSDAVSGEPISFATVVIQELSTVGTITDSIGNFIINDLPIGRYTVESSFVGYQPAKFNEIMVSSAKEVYIDFKLTENNTMINEVVVRPTVNKIAPLNAAALVGARMFSVEEASRYAGGFDDPARLASSFAGVSSGGTNSNGISVHGNSPHLLQWKLEGIEIPNPSHFAESYSVGNGLISALSAQVMGNSDFMSGAFPAMYNNALAGVFDINLKKGNAINYEHTIQVGTLGVEAASEGPINKKSGSSYIFNYRYATTSLAYNLNLVDKTGDILFYQDLNFKLNFPTKRIGNFSIYGVALSNHGYVEPMDPSEWESTYDQNNVDVKQKTAFGGVSHRVRLANGGIWSTNIGASYSRTNNFEEYLIEIDDNKTKAIPYGSMNQTNQTFTFKSTYKKQLSKRFNSELGTNIDYKIFDLDFKLSPEIDTPMEQIYQANDNTSLISAFSNNQWNITSNLLMNFGLSGQILTLNDKWSLEPRANLQWKPTNKGTLSFGYGLHSRMEKMDVLFVKIDDSYVNKNLDFTKAHHLMLSYSYQLTDILNFKVETYYQNLYDVPVELGGTYSIVNRYDYYIDKQLVNEGKGRNYGIDLSLERYLHQGYYFMANASFFKSEYRDALGKWHDTRYDRGYMTKLLGGKEWMIGRKKRNILNINAKITYQGGLKYSPIDKEATLQNPDYEVQYDETKPFTEQFKPSLNVDFSISYKINAKKVSHEFAVKYLNVTNEKAFVKHVYNEKKEVIEPYEMSFVIPNIAYKINF